MERRVILGIGNIGKQYERTRHNLGFDVCDLLAEAYAARFDQRKWQADLAEVQPLPGSMEPRLLLVKPRTYVNRSGAVAQAVCAFYKLQPQDLLVVVDDIHLRLGDLRLRGNGSHGGHNGLRDIERCLGRGYPRLRLGIGKPDTGGSEQVGHVLGRFAPDEQDDAQAMRLKAVSCCRSWLGEGLEAAMRFNGPLRPPPPKPKPKAEAETAGSGHGGYREPAAEDAEEA